MTDAQVSKDVAVDAGDAMAATADVIVSSEGMYGGGVQFSVGNADVQSSLDVNCSGPNSTGWFTCAATTERGLSVTRAIRFWNGTSFGLGFSAATDSVNHALNASGTLTPTANKTIWAKRSDSLTMKVARGANPTRTWIGTGKVADSSKVSENSQTRVYHYTAANVISNVVFNIPRSANPYPASGSISHDAVLTLNATDGTHTQNRTVTRHAVVTFNGTANVTLVVGELTCALNLATHAVTGCH
ncbi:MAG: hypothetical protein M3081_13240 [Gemmatimonadota bacterium]|nr:hypothetical protein [Gemmatimonadota bacterium]